MFKTILATLVMILSSFSYAEIYKWVDENGKTQFGDKPPQSRDFKTLDDTPTPPRNEPSTVQDATAIKQRTQKLLDAMDAERQAKQARKSEEPTAKQKECQRAKEYERKIHRGGIYNLDKDGNRVYLSEAERPKEIARINQLIKQHCQ